MIKNEPFRRIGTVEPSDENKTDVNDVKDEFVMKKRVGMFWIFLNLKLGLSSDYFRKLRKRPI